MLPKKQFQPIHKTPIKKNKKVFSTPVLMGGGAGCIEEGRVDTNVERCGFQIDRSGISYKEELKRIKKQKRPKDPTWNALQFNIVNPTLSPCSFDLFNGYTTTPTFNSPTGYVPQNPNPLITNPSYYATPILYPDVQCSTVDTSTSFHFQPLATCYVSSTNKIYVASISTVANDILVINPSTNAIVNTIPTSLVNPSWMMVYASVQNAAYLIDTATTGISVIDCATETQTMVIDLSLLGAPSQIAYSAANNFLYVTIPTLNKIYYIDCSMNIIIGSITLSTNCTTLTTWTNGANSYAIVLNSVSATAYLINTNTNTLSTAFVIPSLPNTAGAICYNSVKDSVYYIDISGVVNEISIPTLTTTATSVSGFGSSYSLFYIPLFNVIYIDFTVLAGASAKILNCVTNQIDASVTTSVIGGIGSRFSYATSNNSVWMTGNSSNTTISKLCNNSIASCYITGSYDYTQFLIELSNCSFEVHSIMIVTETPEALNNPFEVTKRDADGNSYTNPVLPNTTISTGQFQQNIGYVEFPNKSLILDNQMIFSSYPIAANSTVKMILYYRQICQLEIYSHQETPCTKSEIQCQDGNSKKTSDLKFFSRRPHKRPEWQKPFKDKVKEPPPPPPHIDKADSCGECFENLGHPIINTQLSKRYIPESALKNIKPIKQLPIQMEVPLCEEVCSGEMKQQREMVKTFISMSDLQKAKPIKRMAYKIETPLCEKICSDK